MALVYLTVGTIFVLYGSKELCIYENGILIPYGLTRKFLKFSVISKIKLNTTSQSFVPEIDIVLDERDVVKYKKTLIHEWKAFYKTMLFGVADKVQVVE
ncbi:MAG: hypothetical protein JSW00_14545 [Thermoplasmata archaeon]|nr:MAG: hypothetical protein JSW00_14545 [Thermoplasmata archaeon]